MYVNMSLAIFSVSSKPNLSLDDTVRSPWRLLSGHERQLSPRCLPAAGFFLQGCVPLKMTKAELIEALAGLPDDTEILTTQPSSR
jgi:hypothetical protein